MLNRLNQEMCNKLLSIYGPFPQLMMMIEECSELQKECCKTFRDTSQRSIILSEELQGELVDVIVMCQQLQIMCGLSDEDINKMAEIKLSRAVKRAELQLARVKE